jgi:hypothetical protein
MRGEGVWADLIRQRFDKAVRRLGLGARSEGFKGLDVSRFRRPLIVPASGLEKKGRANGQLDLF